MLHAYRLRFIPACVGNSSPLLQYSKTTRHGSSPRVWGTHRMHHPISDYDLDRFIPACVGNSSTGMDSLNSETSRFIPACVGNSTPEAGTTMLDRRDRFIPACVGNSGHLRLAKYQLKTTVHPRVCGELSARSIPSTNSVVIQVHPRVCGELCVTRLPSSVITGSSPRVWGTHQQGKQDHLSGRFIPACVGNSWPHSQAGWALALATVHPRVCGELHAVVAGYTIAGGSSPRVWGTPG